MCRNLRWMDGQLRSNDRRGESNNERQGVCQVHMKGSQLADLCIELLI